MEARGDAVALSALFAPALPDHLRYDDRVRAGMIWFADKLEALVPSGRR